MSAFLGPIHYWLYNKINIQNDIVEDIIKLAEEDYQLNYREYLDSQYGIVETQPLEDVIDGSNIHGWLQERIHRVEKRLAYLVTNLLEEEAASLDKIKDIYKSIAIKKSSQSQVNSESTVSELYKVAVNDSLLDGMPCDHVNAVSSQEGNKIEWKRTTCVHGGFWDDIGGDVSVYYQLRDEYIEGFLKGTGAEYKKIDEASYQIIK